MKIHKPGYRKTWFTRCCRSGGGLHLGIRLHLPVSIWDGPLRVEDNPDNHAPTNTTYRSVMVLIGLLFWEVQFFIDYGHQPIPTHFYEPIKSTAPLAVEEKAPPPAG